MSYTKYIYLNTINAQLCIDKLWIQKYTTFPLGGSAAPGYPPCVDVTQNIELGGLVMASANMFDRQMVVRRCSKYKCLGGSRRYAGDAKTYSEYSSLQNKTRVDSYPGLTRERQMHVRLYNTNHCYSAAGMREGRIVRVLLPVLTSVQLRLHVDLHLWGNIRGIAFTK